MSVLSILCLHPGASALIKIENKYIRSIWQMFTLSLVAQLATFPICLYYFGTFPTYFFIANLIIVPLVSLIMYAAGGIVPAKGLSLLLPDLSFYFYYLPVGALRLLVHFMTSLIRMFESLPYALIQDAKVTFPDLLLIFAAITGLLIFLMYKKSKALITGLSAVLILSVVHIYTNMRETPGKFTVYNRKQSTEIKWSTGKEEKIITAGDLAGGYKYIEIGDRNILILSSDNWENKTTENKFEIESLVLTNDDDFSLYTLTQLLSIGGVVIDSSLSAHTRSRLSKECQKLNIPCHDVAQSGAFSLIF
jgi:competence protein ComEC